MPRYKHFDGERPPVRPARIDPPAHLSAGARRVWREVTRAVDAGHFQPGDFLLLEDYCETAVQLRLANAELAERGRVTLTGKRSAYLLAKGDLARHLASLTVQLRLNPRARSDGRRKPPPESNAADLAALRGDE